MHYFKYVAYNNKSQSLFYWNPFCNVYNLPAGEKGVIGRNPYFIGILSAMKKTEKKHLTSIYVAILILLESFLQ